MHSTIILAIVWATYIGHEKAYFSYVWKENAKFIHLFQYYQTY